MKRVSALFLTFLLCVVLFGCTNSEPSVDILTTTAPLYEFTRHLCRGTDLTVSCLITESVSCLHDYTLQTRQMRAIESASVVIISGAGLEESFYDVLTSARAIVDTSEGIALLCADGDGKHDGHNHDHQEFDPHVWLSPWNAKIIVENIYNSLSKAYPQHQELLLANRNELDSKLDTLIRYAEMELRNVSSRQLVTFHDGFSYMADAFDLQIIHAIEEESGREASASELISLCEIVQAHSLKCIFTECNGSTSAAQIIAAETGVEIYQLDTGMSGNGYFSAMYHNIDTLREALE